MATIFDSPGVLAALLKFQEEQDKLLGQYSPEERALIAETTAPLQENFQQNIQHVRAVNQEIADAGSIEAASQIANEGRYGTPLLNFGSEQANTAIRPLVDQYITPDQITASNDRYSVPDLGLSDKDTQQYLNYLEQQGLLPDTNGMGWEVHRSKDGSLSVSLDEPETSALETAFKVGVPLAISLGTGAGVTGFLSNLGVNAIGAGAGGAVAGEFTTQAIRDDFSLEDLASAGITGAANPLLGDLGIPGFEGSFDQAFTSTGTNSTPIVDDLFGDIINTARQASDLYSVIKDKRPVTGLPEKWPTGAIVNRETTDFEPVKDANSVPEGIIDNTRITIPGLPIPTKGMKIEDLRKAGGYVNDVLSGKTDIKDVPGDVADYVKSVLDQGVDAAKQHAETLGSGLGAILDYIRGNREREGTPESPLDPADPSPEYIPGQDPSVSEPPGQSLEERLKDQYEDVEVDEENILDEEVTETDDLFTGEPDFEPPPEIINPAAPPPPPVNDTPLTPSGGGGGGGGGRAKDEKEEEYFRLARLMNVTTGGMFDLESLMGGQVAGDVTAEVDQLSRAYVQQFITQKQKEEEERRLMFQDLIERQETIA